MHIEIGVLTLIMVRLYGHGRGERRNAPRSCSHELFCITAGIHAYQEMSVREALISFSLL